MQVRSTFAALGSGRYVGRSPGESRSSWRRRRYRDERPQGTAERAPRLTQEELARGISARSGGRSPPGSGPGSEALRRCVPGPAEAHPLRSRRARTLSSAAGDGRRTDSRCSTASRGRRAGVAGAGADWPFSGLTMLGLQRLDDLQACIEQVVAERVEGDVIEAGVWRGGASILIRATLDSLGAGPAHCLGRRLLPGTAQARCVVPRGPNPGPELARLPRGAARRRCEATSSALGSSAESASSRGSSRRPCRPWPARPGRWCAWTAIPTSPPGPGSSASIRVSAPAASSSSTTTS